MDPFLEQKITCPLLGCHFTSSSDSFVGPWLKGARKGQGARKGPYYYYVLILMIIWVQRPMDTWAQSLWFLDSWNIEDPKICEAKLVISKATMRQGPHQQMRNEMTA